MFQAARRGSPMPLLGHPADRAHLCRALDDPEQCLHKQLQRKQDLGAACPPGGHPGVGGRR